MGKKIGDYTIYEKSTMCNGNCKECKYRVGDETKKITSYCKLVMIEYQNEELEKDDE